jgi:predicted permease
MTAILDLRYAVRLLIKSPVFALTSILSLAAGIAGTTAIFSLADAMLLRPRAGVANPATLVDIGRTTRGSGFDNFGYPLFEVMRSGTTTLETMSAIRLSPQIMSLGDARSSERVFAALVSGNYFELVGARPALGRFFAADEDSTPDAHPVVVLNHDFWMRRFDGRRDIVGQSLRLNNRPYTVVGVAEQGFSGTTFLNADFWAPMAMEAHVSARERSLLADHGSVWMTAIGRLKPGVGVSQARDELHAIMTNYLKSRGDDRADRWGIAVAISARIPGPNATPVFGFIGLLAGLTMLVLVIACSNVAGLLVARGLDRRREFATRLALGASRSRLIGQLLLEGFMLAAMACALSVPLTQALVGLLAGYQPSIPVPLAFDLRVDPSVHLVAALLSAVAAVGFTLLPALQSTRVDVAPALRGANASADRRRTWLRQALVCTQVAIALLLVVVAGLFLRSLQEAANVDIALNPDGVDTLQIDSRIAGRMTDAEGVAVVDALRDQFSRLPGVTAVGASRMVPLQGGRLGLGRLRAPGYTGPDNSDAVNADWDAVSVGYFEALQMPIVAGRAFAPEDRPGAPSVAIVNRTMAERLWPGQDPIGRTLIQESGQDTRRPLQIVGVARDSKYASVSEGPRNFIYVPLAQQFLSEVTFYVRRQAGASRVNDLRQAVAAFDPMLPVIHTETLTSAMSITLLPQRIAAWIAGAVGSLGLFLAALGLYGLVSYTVSQRSREIAIRLAVGASARSIVWLVLRQASILSGVGAVVGLVLAIGLAQLVGSFLVGLGPIDPLAFGTAIAVLGGVILIAAWAPARRAAALDPVRSLRAD